MLQIFHQQFQILSCVSDNEVNFFHNGLYLKQVNGEIVDSQFNSVSFVILGKEGIKGVSEAKPYSKDIFYAKSQKGQIKRKDYEKSDQGKKRQKSYEKSDQGEVTR